MKKLLALLLALALLVSVSATAFAIGKMEHKTTSGTIKRGGRLLNYYCDLGVSTTQLSVSMSYDDPNTLIECAGRPDIVYYAQVFPGSWAVGTGYSRVSASTNNHIIYAGKDVAGTINHGYSTFKVAKSQVAELQMD